jgi:hypothetical protein
LIQRLLCGTSLPPIRGFLRDSVDDRWQDRGPAAGSIFNCSSHHPGTVEQQQEAVLAVQQGIDLFVDTPCVTNERLSKCHGYSSALVVCGRSDESMDDRDSRRSEAACAVLERRGESAGCETVFAAPGS